MKLSAVLLLCAITTTLSAQHTSVGRIRAYRLELEETLGTGPEAGGAAPGIVRLERIVPGSGPQNTEIVYRSVELEDEHTPWRRRSSLLTAVLTQNIAAMAPRREFYFCDGAMVLCIARADTGDAEWEEYYFDGKNVLGVYRVTRAGQSAVTTAQAGPRAAAARECGERLAEAFAAMVKARELVQ
ncbi:MAG: hypothetical protein HY962_10345 [Ignavibacteriae bacterium]|nr:hypothetical protein [Ignavibacteriota bacterium]